MLESKAWYLIDEHEGFEDKRIPSSLPHPITSLQAANSCEVEWTVDVCILMSKVNPTAKWDEVVA
jgi:hypothetical protein